jgi:molecular chaperone HscA
MYEFFTNIALSFVHQTTNIKQQTIVHRTSNIVHQDMALISINLKTGSVDDEKEVIVGIDLGTTNSLVAYMKEGVPTCVSGENGKNTLVPSVLHFKAFEAKNTEGPILVGDEAKGKLITDPQNTIYSVKRLMGKAYKDVQGQENYFGYKIINTQDDDTLVKVRVGDKFYTPTELSSFILKELKTRVEKDLGKAVSKAVITVPAYFNDAQRQATRDAGKLAGLDVLRIVNEPTAAALAYGLDRKAAETIAVYDLGGGTFDISILQLQDGIFEVLSTNGDTFLGGDDLDRVIVDYWIKENNISNTLIINDKAFGQDIRLAAEKAKKALGTEGVFELRITDYELRITRDVFESLISPLVEKTIQCCKSALADAKLTAKDIQSVVMVGGSTRVPLVKKTVSDFFGIAVFDDVNPDEVVALGAAIQADVLAGNQRDILLIDITPLSLGIETVGGLMDTIIPRNSKIPSKAGREYTTSVDGQKNLKVAIFQGERDLVQHNRKLGEFVLRGIPPMPAGLPKIEISFYLDADGILRVKAKELRSNVEQEVTMKASYGLSDEEMAMMLIDSIQNASSDLQMRSLLEARNEANNVLLAVEKFLIHNAEILSEEEKATTQSLAKTVKTAVAGDNKDAINAAMDDLNTYTEPMAHRAMDVNISAAMKGKKI